MLDVKLLRYTPDGEKLVASAAKLCYSPVGVEDIEESLDEESVSSFLSLLMDMGHESPIEHVSYTFGVQGVSRTLTHQLVRHRIASFSQQSQRYVKLEQFDYIIPPDIEKNEKAKEIFIKAMEEDQKHYDQLSSILFEEHFNKHRQKGLFTMNARTLLNFFKLRCCNRAQWEIRELAIKMLKEVRGVSPVLFKNAGPSCLNGPCKEGAMTCGNIIEVREFFKEGITI